MIVAGARPCSCGSKFIVSSPVRLVFNMSLNRFRNLFAMVCDGCGMRGPVAADEREAIRLWQETSERTPRAEWIASDREGEERERVDKARALGMM